jgi:hypothetical protein
VSAIATALKHMLAAGMEHAAIIAAVEEMEAAASPAKSSAAERQKRYRERKKRVTRDVTSVTSVTSDEHRNEPAPPRARVEYTSLPSLRSEEVEDNPISPNGEMSPLKPKPAGFDRFWDAYPNKVGKQAALKSYVQALRRIPGHDPPGQLLAAVERAKRSAQWIRGYVPHPKTWLNEGRWDDEPSQVIPIRQPDDPRPDPKRLAREANLTRAFVGSEIAPRRW